MGRLFVSASSHHLESETVPVQDTVFTASPITLSAWFRTTNADAEQQILGMYDNTTSNQWTVLMVSDLGSVRAHRRVGGGSAIANTTTSLIANTWHHGCAVMTGINTADAFLDNRGDATDTTSFTDSNPLTVIGVGQHRDTSPSRPFDGDMAELGMWDIALNFFERDQLARWRYSPLMVRPEHLIWYRSFRFPDFNFDPLLPPAIQQPVGILTNSGSSFGAHPPGIIYPIPERISVLSGGISVGITVGEIVAAATSFDNRPHKPATIFVPSS